MNNFTEVRDPKVRAWIQLLLDRCADEKIDLYLDNKMVAVLAIPPKKEEKSA